MKRDLLGLPDPFAILTVDGEQTNSTSVSQKSLSPTWNSHFDMLSGARLSFFINLIFLFISTVRQSSIVAIQLFDRKKFKKRDQGRSD